MANVNRKINIYINGKEVENSLGGVTLAMKKARAEMKHLTFGTEDYNNKLAEIRQYRKILDDHSNQIKGVAKQWSLVKNEILTIGTGVIGANIAQGIFQKITSFIPETIKGVTKLDDELADVRKTTGLTTQEIEELNKELRAMDTRTPSTRLRELAEVAGRLGIKGKEDIMGFVRAANQIEVALGKELGADAIKNIGKMVSIFKLEEKFGLEDGMLKIASAVNEIGMASTASEGYLVEFTKRMSGISGIANVTAADNIALAGTLDSLGQTAEVSSTALSKLFVKMGSDVKTFARLANVSEDVFRNTLEKSAVDALKLLLTEVGKSATGVESLSAILGDMGVDGGRVTGVLGTLAKNVDELGRQQMIANRAFEQGTSITDEYNIKNENLAAQWEKLQKLIAKIFTSPTVVNWVKKLIEGMTDMAKWIRTNGTNIADFAKLLMVAGTAMVSYKAAVYLASVVTRDFTKQTILSNVATKASVALNNTARASLALYAGAKALLTGNTQKATDAMRVFNSVTKMNPIGLLVGGLIAAGGAMYVLNKRKNEAAQNYDFLANSNERYNQKISEERSKMESMFYVLKKTNPESKERQRILDDINANYGTTLKNLSDEGEFLRQLETAYQDVSNAMMRKIALETQQEELTELFKQKIQAQKGLIKAEEDLLNAQSNISTQTGLFGFDTQKSAIEKAQFAVDITRGKLEEISKQIQKVFDETNKVIKDLPAESTSTFKTISEEEKKAIEERTKANEKYLEQLKDLNAQLIYDEREKELAILRLKQERMVKEVEESKANEGVKNRMIETLAQVHREEVNAINLKYDIKDYQESEKLADKKKQMYDKVSKALMSDRDREVQTAIESFEELITWSESNDLVDETARLREKLNETIAEIDKKYATKNGLALFGLDDESIRIIEDKLRHVSDLWGSLIDIRANREDKELQDFRLRSEKQIEILKNQRERGYLTDEKFEAKKKELQDKVDAQALKVRQKQAKREKALAMFNAAINTASAVSQINANPAVNLDVTQTLRGLLTGLVLATGLAQQAAIASQPIPAFAKGVLNFKGGRALVGEEGPELVTLPAGSNVFPAPVTADIARMVDAFTGNNSNTNAPSVSSSNNSNTPDINFDNSNNDAMMQMMLKLMGLISDPENRRAIIVRDDLTEFDQQTKFLQDFGSLKRVG